MRKNFKAFTLVEMLIVMGIIIILMTVGIASGRFAIRRANKIEHQNAAEQIYQGLQSYYADNREYPGKQSVPNAPFDMSELMAQDVLGVYIDDFDGGSEASFAYWVDDTGQEILICVTYGGVGDANELGIYCTGNAVGSMVDQKDLEYDSIDYNGVAGLFNINMCSDWIPDTKSWGTCSEMQFITTY